MFVVTAAAAEGEEQAGITTYDHQGNGNQGNRVVPLGDRVDVCWTHSESEESGFPDRSVKLNRWLTEDEVFLWEDGIKTSGEHKAGYPTMGVLPDGRAVIAFHQQLTAEPGSEIVCKVVVETAPGFGIFNTPVVIDPEPVEGGYPIWPHLVAGSDSVIHIVVRVPNDPGEANPICYSRSTDQGLTFSSWIPLVADAEDAAVAVSRDGVKVAVAWVEKIDEALGAGHLMYIESLDHGLTWNEPVWVTQGRYLDSFPVHDTTWRIYAKTSNVDIAYDNNDDLHAAFAEGRYLHKAPGEFETNVGSFSRIIHWDETSDSFSRPSGRYGTYRWITDEEYPVIDTALNHQGWWGANSEIWNRDDRYCGAWNPQLAFWGDTIVVSFGGNRLPWDLSIAYCVNGEIYVTVSEDNGYNWKPLEGFDWDESFNRNNWWRYHMAYVTNVTNTQTPDARQGFCADEDFHSVWPWIGDDSILHVTYLKDLFSGPALTGFSTEGYYTDNPVMYLPVKLRVGKVYGIPPEDTIPAVKDNYVSPTCRIEVAGPNLFSHRVSFNVTGSLTQGFLKVFDAAGALVKTVFEGGFTDSQTLTWDGTDTYGSKVAQGVYFYSFVTPEYRKNGRLILIR